MTTTETPLYIRQAEGLRAFANMIEQNPELAELFESHFRYLSMHAFDYDKPQESFGLFARAALQAGAKVTKNYGDKFAEVTADWGAICFRLQTDREEVCERVQVGTETVTRTERDPKAVEAALAEIPETEVTEEVPVYEWQCTPLLASSSDGVS